MNESDAVAVIAACWTVVQVCRLTLAHRRTVHAAQLKAAEAKGDADAR